MPAFFTQDCPTCGRTLRVNLADANQRVGCQHCQGAFVAIEPEQRSTARRDWRTSLMKRADELLALVASHSELAPAN